MGMAERRFSKTDSVRSARRVALILDGLFPVLSDRWFIEDAADNVDQPFYAAIDGDQRLCWTDDRDRAACFGSKQAAERFAVDRFTIEVRIVPHH